MNSFRGNKAAPAQQALRGCGLAHELAPPLGPQLGRGEVLLRRLPAPRPAGAHG
jgi:hypothetical protein